MLATLFAALAATGSFFAGALLVIFAVAATAFILGLASEAALMWFRGNIYGMGVGAKIGAVVALAWSVYALAHTGSASAAFLPVLGLIVVALAVLAVIKSYIGMQPIPDSEWA